MQALGDQLTDEERHQACRHEEFLQPVRAGLCSVKNGVVSEIDLTKKYKHQRDLVRT